MTDIQNLSTQIISEFDLKIKQPTNAWVFMAQVTQLYAASATPPAAGTTLTPAQDMANVQSLVQYMDTNFDLGIDQPAEAFLFVYWVGVLYQANIRPLIVGS